MSRDGFYGRKQSDIFSCILKTNVSSKIENCTNTEAIPIGSSKSMTMLSKDTESTIHAYDHHDPATPSSNVLFG